jgi:hypothetical protein
MKIKKAAMFGLDARIALAIFGALSVISGAALYSAIQKAKVTAFVIEALEIGKAWEQYYFDTGSKLEKSMAVGVDDPYYYYRKIENLVKDPGYPGWKGPYIKGELTRSKVTNPYALTHDMDEIISSALGFFRDPAATGFNNVYCVSGTTDCSLWIQHSSVAGDLPTSFYKAIDEHIDGNDSPLTGNYRYRNNDTNTYTYSFIKYIAVTNPVDNP